MNTRGAALVVVLLAASRAHAEPGLGVEGCSASLTASLPAAVELELDVLSRELGALYAQPEAVTVRCLEDRARLLVRKEGTSRASHVELELLAPEHRARAIGLAVAELVHSMSQPEPAPSMPRAAPVPAPKDLRSDPRTPDRLRPSVSLGGVAEWVGEPNTLLVGARVALRYPLGAVLTPSVSIDGTIGGTATPHATVRAKTVGGAAHLYFGTRVGPLRAEVGPGARLGWVVLSGHPDSRSDLEGRRVAAPWAGPEVRARVAHGESTRAWSPRLGVELGAGYAALPVRGLLDGDEAALAFDGPWLSVCVEVGLSL